MPQKTNKKPKKKTEILNVAEDLLQRRGFSAFSYQDIADALGMRKASLHYHFASKADLGVALAERQANRALKRLQVLDQAALTSWQRLDVFFKPYLYYIKSCERLASGAMLAAGYAALNETMQDRVAEYFLINRVWLTRLLTHGRNSGEFYFGADPAVKADAILSTLHGAALMAMAGRNADFVEPLVDDIKASLGAG